VRLTDGDVLSLATSDTRLDCLLLGDHGLLALLLRTDLTAGTFASTRVGVRTLAADRQALAMTEAAVAADLHQALDVLPDLTAEVTFYLQVAVDELAEPHNLFFGKVADAGIGVDPGLPEDLLARGEPDSKYVGQSDLDALLAREVDA
jgi:hypothetical protein